MTVSSPFMTRGTKIGQGGRAAETKLARRIKAKLTPASGAMASAKGDMVKLDFLLEAKSTQNDSMSLKRDWTCKIYQEALELTKHPALAITFTTPEGNSQKRDRWIMIPEHVFLELIGE